MIKKMNFNIGGTGKQGGEMSLFQRLEKKVLTKAGPWVALCARGGSQALAFDAAVNKHVLASQIVLVLSTSVLGRRPSSPQGPSGAT